MFFLVLSLFTISRSTGEKITMNFLPHFSRRFLFWPIAIFTICLASWLRFHGQDWDEGQLLHPDERFIVMLTSAIKSVRTWGQYFDTANSTLSPYNNNFGFYVYGTLPLFLFRYLADAVGSGVSIFIVGRSISALLDIGSCLLVFISAWILFGRCSALIALYLSATCVASIQLSHFATFDSQGAFYSTLVLLLSIIIANKTSKARSIFCFSIISGIAAGLAAASKINLILVFALVPISILAATISSGWRRAIFTSTLYSIFSFCALAITFRIFQPYAFAGPGFFDISLNPQWVSNMQSLAQQAQVGLDPPPAVQWFKRSSLHGLINMITWGYGLPIGIMAFISLFYSIYRVFSIEGLKASSFTMPLIWGVLSLSAYVIGIAIQPIRYGAPVYPALTIILAGVVAPLFSNQTNYLIQRWNGWELACAKIFVGLVLLSSLIWSIAFTKIYRIDNPRIAASRWMFQEIPGSINFGGRSNLGEQIFPIQIQAVEKSNNFPIRISLWMQFDFLANRIFIPKISNLIEGEKFICEIFNGLDLLSTVELEAKQGQLQQVFPTAINLKSGANYRINIKPKLTTNAEIKLTTLGHESSWDDSLPMRIDGFDPYGGIYDGDSNLEIYWRDSQGKAARLAKELAKADYFYLSSNRQVGTVGRLPEEYPVAALFYQKLLGCSAREYIPECYARAYVGERNGQLGFELVKTFESYPSLFGIQLNTQLADETFQVYDHPRVMIFKNKNKLSAEELEKLLTPIN